MIAKSTNEKTQLYVIPAVTDKKEKLFFNRAKLSLASIVYRNEHKLTMNDLAALIGFDRYYVASMEYKRNDTSLEVAINFCRVTGQDIYSFFD